MADTQGINPDKKGIVFESKGNGFPTYVWDGHNLTNELDYKAIPAKRIVGVLTGKRVHHYTGFVIKTTRYYYEVEFNKDYCDFGPRYVQKTNIQELVGLSESGNAETMIQTIINNNKLIYENNLLASRLAQSSNVSDTEKNKIASLQRNLFERDAYLRNTAFGYNLGTASSKWTLYPSYLKTVVSNANYGGLSTIPENDEYVVEFNYDYENAPTTYATGANPASAIISILFNKHFLQSIEDLHVSTDLLLMLAQKNAPIVEQIRTELRNVEDIYSLNRRLGYTGPDIPTAASIVQPTFENKSGTITITPQSGSEYSLDGRNFFASNVFANLAPGNYTLYVRKITDKTNVEHSDNAITINDVPTSDETTTTDTAATGNSSLTTKIILGAGILISAIKLFVK